jgi:hypothetical protein
VIPSHGRFLSRVGWEALVIAGGLSLIKSELHPRKQPDLEWYFETAATPAENRLKVLEAVKDRVSAGEESITTCR